jgi:membrane associated rhomboid family serine protease
MINLNDIVLYAIIAINVIVSYKGFNDRAFSNKYEFHVGSIRAGEQYRMFTSAFLHADFLHLFFNMLTLYFFAPVVIAFMGPLTFLLVYFVSLVAGNLLALYFHKDNYWYRALGASGAVTGVLYAAILLAPNMELSLYFFIPVPAYVFGIGYMLYSIYGMKAKNDNIGHVAHFGGAIGGFAITLSREPHMLFDNTLMVILLTIPIIILLYLAKTNKI